VVGEFDGSHGCHPECMCVAMTSIIFLDIFSPSLNGTEHQTISFLSYNISMYIHFLKVEIKWDCVVALQ
jgi:hypothetical protein